MFLPKRPVFIKGPEGAFEGLYKNEVETTGYTLNLDFFEAPKKALLFSIKASLATINVAFRLGVRLVRGVHTLVGSENYKEKIIKFPEIAEKEVGELKKFNEGAKEDMQKNLIAQINSGKHAA